MASEKSLAAAALVIALVALAVTSAQMLQQYLATADGYRKCQESVIGQWHAWTRRRFRWSEFRFETTFVTPHFRLVNMGARVNDALVLTNSDRVPRLTESNDPVKARVTWLYLLDELCSVQKMVDWKNEKWCVPGEGVSYPAVMFQRRSWDFMPPDVIRPFASATLGDMLVIVHRLGMKWLEIRPSVGILRAEGENGMSISSIMVHGLGVLIYFAHDDVGKLYEGNLWEYEVWKGLYIPHNDADKLAFGIIPGDRRLGLPDFKVGTDEDVLKVMSSFDQSQGKKHVRRLRWETENQHFVKYGGFGELLSIIAPWILTPGCSITRVPRPSHWIYGPLLQAEGDVVFKERVQQFIGEQFASNRKYPKVQWIHDSLCLLQERHGRWDFEISRNTTNTPSPAYDATLRELHVQCTDYLVEFNEIGRDRVGKTDRLSSNIFELLRRHMCRAVAAFEEANQRVKENRAEGDRYGWNYKDSQVLCEVMHIHVNEVAQLAQDLIDAGVRGPQGDVEDIRVEIIEAWFVMIFRALLWNRSVSYNHAWSQEQVIPSRYWRSQIPVYIG
ncbi:modin [Phlyctema vagabunda]|uniref:Modin n=1 Tax=Phlyctema vagabunda TaxID=108571 RepID=A0ABR4PHI4_9HELO